MITTAKFYESFDKAGFLKTALWTPSIGVTGAGLQQTAQVRFRAPGRDALAGEFNITDYTIRYPSGVFPGLKYGEVVTVDGAQFKVREGPHSLLNGTAVEVFLAKI